MTWVDGATTDHLVTAVYHDRMTFGDVIVSTDALAAHVAQDNVTVVLVDVADGADLDAAKADVAAVTAAFGAPDPMDRGEYTRHGRRGDRHDAVLRVRHARRRRHHRPDGHRQHPVAVDPRAPA